MLKSFAMFFITVLLPFGLAIGAGVPAASRDYRNANVFYASGRFRDALPLYQRLLVAPPEGVSPSDIRTRIGDTYFRIGSFKNALDAYRGALNGQNESRQPETHYWIGFCCFLLGRDSEAVAEFLKIPELYPHSGMWVGTAYYWAGRACERMGRTEEAAAYYRKAGGNGRSMQGRFAMKKAEAVKETSTKSEAPNLK